MSVGESPLPSPWSRATRRAFAAMAALLVGATVLGTTLLLAFFGDDPSSVSAGLVYALVAWVLGGPTAITYAVARLLRAPGHAVVAAGLVGAVALCLVLVGGSTRWFAEGPLALAHAPIEGTIDDVVAHPHPAWARVHPAYVDTVHVGFAVTSAVVGRREAKVRTCAPVVSSRDAREQVSLFVCGRVSSLRGAGAGTGAIEGRLARPAGLEVDAIAAYADRGGRVGPAPRVIVPGLGGERGSAALGFALLFLLAVAAPIGTALAAARLASDAELFDIMRR